MKPIYDRDTCDWRHARGLLIDANLQALDIKHMAEFENIYKKRCQLAISMYKSWIEDYKSETDVMELLYGSIEGMMLKQQAQDSIKLYWIVRKDFRRALEKYLNKVASHKCKKLAA